MKPQNYRPDIDGLRAIAVLSVLFHHLNGSLLPGGFVGVDIFFVISGFLITSQVHAKAREGTFSLLQFYKRRINRIVPALLVVLVACLAAGVMFLSPADLLLMTRSAVFASLGLSNLFFWREYGNYFSGNSREAPLLHTWSLGVEEQYYALWPLFVLLLVKFRPGGGALPIALLSAAAIALSEAGTAAFASASYYLLPTRLFELMIGGLLAVHLAEAPPLSGKLARAALLTGLLLVGGSLFWLNKKSAFPGVNAVWPCAGTALLIWAGSGQAAPSRILANRPMIFLGLISYSLYLWHWPFIAFLAYLNHPIDLQTGLSVAAASILLAWLSWKYIEVPMRRSGIQQPFSRVFTLRFFIPVALLALFLAAVIHTGGFPERFNPRVVETESALQAKPEEMRRGCHVPTALYKTPPRPECRLGADKAVADGILIGDSYANHFSGMLDVMAKARGLTIMDYTMDACPPILGYMPEGAPAYAEKCRLRNQATYDLILRNRYGRVILAADWPDSPEAGNQLRKSVEALISAGATVTIVLSNTSIERASSCPVRRLMYETTESCEGERRDPPAYFNELRSHYPQLRFIEPDEILCRNGRCSPVLEETLLYRDNYHLNDTGSRLIGQALLRQGWGF